MNLGKDLWGVLHGAVTEWTQDKVPRMAAALAFYTIFSLTPIVIISVAIGGTFFGRDAALREIVRQVNFLVGPAGGDAIDLLVNHAPDQQASTMAMLFGMVTMLFAATGAFAELKDSLNTIWEVQPIPGLGLGAMIRDRLLSFGMVLVIGFLLMVSLVTSAILQSLTDRVDGEFAMLEAGHAALSLSLITVLFALIYKILPDARVPWCDVWIGAVVAAALFTLGKSLFGIYLGHSSIGSSYGAAGSLVIVVLWVYYSSLILLFGAELSPVQSRLRGVPLIPTETAIKITEHDRVQQGLPHTLPAETNASLAI